MFRLYQLILPSLLCASALWGQKDNSYPQNDFIPPLDIDLVLSGTFGELRSNHFHSGIDIKTQGRINLPVKAIAAGQVVRIKVSPYGYGRALYLRHDNGYTSVYAHLESFAPAIEAYLLAEQKRLQRNEIELFPPAGLLSFEQAELIAYSGNSGGSGGPHLHFEIRDSRNEKPINPLFFGFKVPDQRAPALANLQVYEFEGGEMIGRRSMRLLPNGPGRYSLAGESQIALSYSAAFGIEAIDRLDGASNRNGVYALSLKAGEEELYQWEAGSFAFAETRYLNSHIDYPQKDCCQRFVHRLYLEPNNELSMYGATAPMHLLELKEDTVVPMQLVVSDYAGNESVLDFSVYKVPASGQAMFEEPELPLFRYDQANSFTNSVVQINMKPHSLYRNLFFEHFELPPCATCLSAVHQLASSAVPVHRYYDLAIAVSNLPQGIDPAKLCIASLKEGEILDYEGGEYRRGWVQARTRQFGEFAVILDSIPPQVRSVRPSPMRLAPGQKLEFEVRDDFSGLAHYRAFLGSEWVPLYYDAKRDILSLRWDHLPVQSGRHSLKLELEDKRQNRTTAYFELILP